MAIQVDPISSPRLITVPVVDGTSITVQSLVNQIRQWEQTMEALPYDKLLSASGKEVLSITESVGITATLENTKIKFADRGSPTDCNIYGGNLVAVDSNGNPMNPVQYSENVTVTVARSSSATMVQDADIDGIKAKTDHLPDNTEYFIDEIKHHGGTYEPDKESLEAIRARIDEIYAKPSGGKGFSI